MSEGYKKPYKFLSEEEKHELYAYDKDIAQCIIQLEKSVERLLADELNTLPNISKEDLIARMIKCIIEMRNSCGI